MQMSRRHSLGRQGIGMVSLALLASLVVAVRADEPSDSNDAARAAYTSAAALQNREAWDLAAEEWASLIASHPGDPLALKGRYYLAVCQIKNGDWPAARQTFRDVIASKADAATVASARWELARGLFQAAQKKPSAAAYEDAAASLRDFLDTSPGHPQTPEAVFFVGESLWQAGKRDAAIEAWQRFVRDHAASPRMPEVLYALGVGLAELKRPADAAATFKRFAESFPSHALAEDVAIWRADVAITTNAAADAEGILVPLAAGKGPRAADALDRLGSVRWAQKNWTGAAEAYARLADTRKEPAQAAGAAASAGRAYVRAGAIEKARPLLARAATQPGAVGADAAHSLALLELDAGRPARALEVATQGIAMLTGTKTADVSRLAALVLDRADALWELPERKAEAAQAYADVVEKYPQQTDVVLAARAMLALALLDQGKSAEALKAADHFLAMKSAANAGSRLLDVKAIRAEALLGLGKPAEAAAAYRDLVTANKEARQRPTWQLRQATALAGAKQWKEVHGVLGPTAPSLTGEAAAEALLLDATALVELDKPSEALKPLATLEKDHRAWPRREETLLLGVRARRESGDRAAALALAEDLVNQFPTGAFADISWYRLGQLRQDASRFDEAIEAYAKSRAAEPQGPRAPWALLATGWCHDAKGRLREAIAAWTELIAGYSASSAASAALLARGDARYRSGDFSGGLKDAEQFLAGASAKGDAAKSVGEARMLAALCLAGEKKHADAVQAFRRLLEEQPGSPAADRAVFEMGLAQMLDGKRDDAVKTFQSLVEKFPQSGRVADAWLEIGEARFDAKAWNEAAAAYEKAITAAGGKADARPIVEQARHKLGWAFSMRKDHAAAAQAFRDQLAGFADGPLAADAQAMLGESLFQAGDHAGAAQALAAALVKPESLSSADLRGLALIRAAECAARRERWDESLSFATRLEKSQPESTYVGQSRYAAAWALQNLGRLDEALARYRALADRGRTELAARARLMEGEVLFEQGNHKDAIKAFFKVAYGYGEKQAPAAFHPWQAQATFEAARCFEVLGKPDQAAKLYGELVDRYPEAEQTPPARKRLEALGTAAPTAARQAS
jgi:TolA-binding protein